MKLRYTIFIAIIFSALGAYAFHGTEAVGQNSTVNVLNPFRVVGGYILPRDASNGLQISSLVNCDTIDTDGDGKLSCGTDDGGVGATDWVNATTYLYPKGGLYVGAQYFTGTSTTASSTFLWASTTRLSATDVWLGTVRTGTWNGTAIADAYVGALPRYVFDKVGKNGWDLDYTDSVDLTFATSTRTFTITPSGASFEYWIQGTKYTSAATSTTITDTEGAWFVYFNSTGNIEASQTPWVIGANDKAFIASLYWDATNDVLVVLDAELHSWVMDASVHRILHSTFGTRYGDGLTVAINGANIDVTGGSIYDEDIKISIVDDDTPDTEWEQALTPANVHILYRTGADGYWRRTTNSTVPAYIDGTDLKINTYSGGSWGLENVTNGRYVAYWVIASGDINSPVFLVPGQESGDTLAAARNGNQLADMDFSNLAIQEYKVIARLLIQKTIAAPYYALEELNDYRNVASEPTSSFTATDHGGLTGLLDDDHTQYGALAQNETVTGTWTFYGSSTAPYFVATSTTIASVFPYASTTAISATNSYLGTVRSGTWNGTALADAYVADDITASNYLSLASWFGTTSAPHLTTLAGVTSIGTDAATTTAQGNWAADAFGIVGKFFASATQFIVNTLATFSQGIVAQVRLNIPNGASVYTNNSGDVAIDTTSGQLRWNNGSATSTATGFYTTGFSWASSTAITGTTTVYLAPAAAALTVTIARCEVPTGTLNVQLYDGTNRSNLFNASSTIGTVNLTTNNTFTAGESMRVDFGTASSSPTTIACRFTYTYNAD